ncbi:MAG: AAA domain-containing protein, partial [Deltaproteobacteria bacterium]|nr:AAA domain-containing protein [Deltaproteobacteria bacterium]
MKTEQHELSFEEYHIEEEPYYLPIADEVTIFKAAFQAKIPVLLKGPTGTGKTRFVEYMSYLLSRDMSIKQKDGNQFLPLITVACHEDLT